MTTRKTQAHTPGPWRIGNVGDCVIADLEVENGTDQNESRAYYGGYLVCESATKANVRLIATAPELLEALQECADKLYQYDGPASDVVERARAAIAKALGQEASA